MVQMIVIVVLSVLCATLPLMMAAFFLVLTVPKKIAMVIQELDTLRGTAGEALRRQIGTVRTGNTVTKRAEMTAPENGTGSASEVFSGNLEDLMTRYFSVYTLLVPAALLSIFYLAGFLLCDAWINAVFNDGATHWLFPHRVIMSSRLLIFSFSGVYLFTLGTMLRRLYLADFNEQIFWGAINRLLLSMGVAMVLLKGGAQLGPEAFFTVGFLANVLLLWLLEKTLKLLNIAQSKQDDLPLQMVKGINIWKEYRLEEEGIENVQNLATADVLELAIKTHYSLRTIIDWIDQAILIARLTSNQVKSLAERAIAISAIEMAAASPSATKDTSVAKALGKVLKTDEGEEPILMSYTMDRLYEDQQVRDLWELWQNGMEKPATKSSASEGNEAEAEHAAAAAAGS